MSLVKYYSVAGLPVTLTRKRVKNLSLRFSKDGSSLLMSVPFFATDHDIQAMLNKCESWVIKNRPGAQRKAAANDKQFDNGDTLWLWGKKYTIELHEAKQYSIMICNETAVFNVKSDSGPEQIKAFLREWYRVQLNDVVPKYMTELVNMIGLVPSEWQGKAMKTRWGTCNCKSGKIWLSLYLAQKDESCLEYVILHELCHLKYPDHGQGFKSLLSYYMPDWKNRKKLLNSIPTDAV